MGAGSSSSIKSVKIEQDKNTEIRSKHQNTKRLSRSVLQDSTPESQNEKENERSVASTDISSDKTVEIETLTKQLTESESQRLDLEDRVQALEDRLELVTAQRVITEEKTCDETLYAKDQYIAKLERERADIEMANKKLKVRCRKKVKSLVTQISEQKQEANFQMMEMREEIEQIREENKQHQSNPLSTLSPVESGKSDKITVPGGEKMALILELSEQVTEHNQKISKLEQDLLEKIQVIDELRIKLRNNMEYMKVRNEQDTGTNVVKNNDRTNNFSKPNSRNTNKITVQPQRPSAKTVREISNANKNDINSLFDAKEDGDDDFAESESRNMVKLTSLLQGVKSKNEKTRLSTDSLDEVSPVEKTNKSGGRSFSGTSRDSGLGSASKRGEKNEKAEQYSEWKEQSFSLESEVSDSDWDRDGSSHSKISSAPPKLQTGDAAKLKKKSNILKKRASSKRPEPSLAFVDNDNQGRQNGQNWVLERHHLSPILSTVEVS